MLERWLPIRWAALGVELLEDRVQPSATSLRQELVLIEPDVPDQQALLRSLQAFPDPGTVLDVVQLHGDGIQELTDAIRASRPRRDPHHHARQ